MIMVCHHLSPDIPSDVAFMRAASALKPSRGKRPADLGVISMFSSDPRPWDYRGMAWLRCIQTAMR